MVFTIVITIAFLAFVWPHFDDLVSRPFRKWVAMGAILLCLSPYFLWATFFPPAIDFTAYSSSIDYEFKNADYAYEFAELNEDAEWVKVS